MINTFKKNKNGITLIVLVITVIVLLILSGVSITIVTNQNGIINTAESITNAWNGAVKNDNQKINSAWDALNGSTVKDPSVIQGYNTGATNTIGFIATGGNAGFTAVAGYQYKLDNGSWSVTVPEGTYGIYTNLTPGSQHTIYARTIDVNGNTSRGTKSIQLTVNSECCFDEDSQILMGDNTTKNIKDVQAGDLVMSLNIETGEFVQRMVSKQIINHNSDDLVYIYLSDGTRIGMRAYHPLYTTDGWKSLRPEIAKTLMEEDISLLEVGDMLIGYKENATIISIELRPEEQNYKTYNLTVEEMHNYIVNGFVAHNADCPSRNPESFVTL